MKTMWKNAILGVVTGDALGCPVEFRSREELAEIPVRGMRGYGTFNLPPGSWTDDSSLTLALLTSIREKEDIDLRDIMSNFVRWLDDGAFTPYGYAYDVGRGTMQAIQRYKHTKNPRTCGSSSEWNNGNGSLMRIMPACLFCIDRDLSGKDALRIIHQVGGLTHPHIRSQMACGLYFCMARAIVNGEGDLKTLLQNGLSEGFALYEETLYDASDLLFYRRLRDLDQFAAVPADQIRSSGYVVDSLEAAVWTLITTSNLKDALLKAVNLGEDTDTIAAIAGGLAGLFYGCEAIPDKWLDSLARRSWIEELCE